MNQGPLRRSGGYSGNNYYVYGNDGVHDGHGPACDANRIGGGQSGKVILDWAAGTGPFDPANA